MGKLKKWAFSWVHQNKLIYNTCWEDPRCDRILMDLNGKSKIVMITSAGCNALDYLLDSPAEIHCVDMNYRQNALLELKRSAFKKLNYLDFFSFFGKGEHQLAADVYSTSLRNELSDNHKEYWDKCIKYFDGKGRRNSFYYRGASGFLAYAATRGLKVKKSIWKSIDYLFGASSIEEQRQYFAEIERRIFSGRLAEKIASNHYTLTLAGVPQSQQSLMRQSYDGGALEYIKDSFRRTFTTLDISENYFYQVYVHGHYTQDCCPEYLKEENFQSLKKESDKIKTHTTTLAGFLKANPGQYSHFVLLDHQDWLAGNDREALKEEWDLILKNSQPGTRILLRSAAKEIDFFPDFVLEKVDFDKDLVEDIHLMDRVGTYASVYLGIVK